MKAALSRGRELSAKEFLHETHQNLRTDGAEIPSLGAFLRHRCMKNEPQSCLSLCLCQISLQEPVVHNLNPTSIEVQVVTDQQLLKCSISDW